MPAIIRQTRRSTPRPRTWGQSPVLTPSQTEKWVRTYGRHARIYTWSFLAVVLCMIFGLIWWEMGEVNDDVVYSFGFAAAVTFVLARWSRKKSTQAWTGVVDDVFWKEAGAAEGKGSPLAVVRTLSGQTHTLRLSVDLSGYFLPGDEIFKISGLEWPEKTALDRAERVCLACGTLYEQGSGRCPRCKAPEPDHKTLVRLAGIP